MLLRYHGVILFIMCTFHVLPALPLLPDLSPDSTPTSIQTQNPQPTLPTIPAFPEQTAVSNCSLDLPDDLFHGIKSACGSKPNTGQLHRARCCPVLAAYLYSAYSKTALSERVKPKSPMVDIPDDTETCVYSLEKELGSRGIELGSPYGESCDFIYCYCGIKLHAFSCPEAFSVDLNGRVIGNGAVEKLENDCFNGAKYDGCSNCLNSLYMLNENAKALRNNESERIDRMHNRDCELMGLTWLLYKNRTAYIRTVSAVLRAIMMSKDGDYNPMFCSLYSDGMPLAVGSSEINDKSSSTVLSLRFQYLRSLSLLCISIHFLF